VITDGSKYGIAYADGMNEESIIPMSAAIGARIKAVTENKKSVSPGEVLNFIIYNMMFIDADAEDDIYDSWEEAVDYAKTYLSAFSNGVTGWEFKLHEPTFPESPSNDNKTEEK
jgi:hypothetical protein